MQGRRIIKFITILGIFIIQFIFLFNILKEKSHHQVLPYIILLLLLLLIIVYRKINLHQQEISFEKFSLIIWIPVSAIITYILNNAIELGSVFAVGIVGFSASCLPSLNKKSVYLKQIPVPIYCGSFIGMTSMNFEYVYLMILTAGIFTAILFSLTKSLFVGVGGKLGTLAFIGFLLSLLLFQLILG